MEIIGRKLHYSGSDVLFKTMQLCCTGDRHDPRLLGEQPSDRDLSRCCLLLFCNLTKQINQCLICFPGLWAKARDDVAEVGAIELRVFVDLAREEACTKRAERNKSDSEFLKCRQNLGLRTSPEQGIFALNRGDRLDCISATDRFGSWLGKAEVLHLAFPDQFLHGTSHVFNGHVRIDAVLVEQIDAIRLEPLE